jgi:hypothetical protein
MTIVHLRVEGLADLVRVAVGPEVPARVDDTVGFRVRRDGIHVFDAATGQRVG